MIKENEDLNVWEKNLYNAIKDVSDINFQKKVWLGKDPLYISSFSEVISVLYDDFDLERYIDHYQSLNGKDSFYAHLSDLNQLINNYKPVGGDECILTDPRWIEITNKAKEIILLREEISNSRNP